MGVIVVVVARGEGQKHTFSVGIFVISVQGKILAGC